MNPSKDSLRKRSPRIVFAWLCALAAASAHAENCTPFLDVVAANLSTPVLSLSSCEIAVAPPWLEGPIGQVWQLTPPAHARWKTALDGDALRPAVLGASLQVRAVDHRLPNGPLLLRISARLPSPAAWRWDGARGELAMVRHPSPQGH